LDFTDQKGSLAAINGWVSQATGGTIPTILDQISADEVMFLINAIYFKGTWQVQFDPKATQPGTFHAADGTLQTVQFMNRPEHLEPRFKLGSVDRIAIAELPYGNGDFAMDIVTGAFGTPVDVDSVAAALTPPTWAGLLASLRDVDFGLVLPKFTMSYERTLNDDLSALGMGVAFTEAAEFPGLSPAALMLEFVKQKTFVQVDEAGTTAGASTVTGVVPVSLSEFRVDHPFVFVIRERRTGTILFVGKVLKIPNG
jgi:serpin B